GDEGDGKIDPRHRERMRLEERLPLAGLVAEEDDGVGRRAEREASREMYECRGEPLRSPHCRRRSMLLGHRRRSTRASANTPSKRAPWALGIRASSLRASATWFRAIARHSEWTSARATSRRATSKSRSK